MRNPIDRYGFQPRVAENNLLIVLGRRVTHKRRLDVLFEHRSHFGEPAKEFDRLPLRQSLEILVRVFAFALVLMPKRARDLLRQLVMETVDEVADVILDISDMQILPTAKARVQQLEQVGQDFRGCFSAWKRLMAKMAGMAALGVRSDNRFCYLG